MRLQRTLQLLLLALLPFGSFISASPLPHPDPEPKAGNLLYGRSKAPSIIPIIGFPKLKSTPESGVGAGGTGRRGLSTTADSWDPAIVITPAVPSRGAPAESLSPQGGVDSGGTGRRDFTTDSGDAYTKEAPGDSAQKDGSITFLSPGSVPPSRHVTCCDIGGSGAIGS